MTEDREYCEACQAEARHKENSPECFLMQEWTKDRKRVAELESALRDARLQFAVDLAHGCGCGPGFTCNKHRVLARLDAILGDEKGSENK